MKNVIIITTVRIHEFKSAGAVRIMNIARSLALRNVRVYLCSSILRHNVALTDLCLLSKNIYLVGEEPKKLIGELKQKFYNRMNFIFIIQYLRKIIKLAKQIDGKKIFYLYPTNEASMDFMALIIIKIMNRYSLYYEVNELRRARLHTIVCPKKLFEIIYHLISYPLRYVKYYIVEILTYYYDGLVAISTSIEKYFKKYNNNILRVPILSNISESHLCKKRNYLQSEKFRIGFFGQITLKKEGFDILYKSLSIVKAQFSNFELHLYGPFFHGYEKELLLNVLPLKHGIKKNIIYHGNVERVVVLKEMIKNHLLVSVQPLNLMTRYNFSTKLSEYLVSGVPVLITDVSDNPLYIKDGYNGFIVQAGNVIAFADKILNIINNYNKIVCDVTHNAYKTARDNFHYANYSNLLYNFFLNKNSVQ